MDVLKDSLSECFVTSVLYSGAETDLAIRLLMLSLQLPRIDGSTML